MEPKIKQVFEQFVSNIVSPIRRETMNGIDYMIAPCVMLTEGVHEGNNGAIFYPDKENSKSVPAWNHKPVVINHPLSAKGQTISAASKKVLEESGVGLLLETANDTKLRTECWLDEARFSKIDPKTYEAVNNNKLVEVSTGLFIDVEVHEERDFNGKKYSMTAMNYRPDHLAILPNSKGACSIADGGGLLQVNQAGQTKEELERFTKDVGRHLALSGITITGNALSYSSIGEQIRKLLASKYGQKGQYWDGYVNEIYPTYVIFYDEAYKIWAMDYTVKNDVVSLSGTAIEVMRVTDYKKVSDGTSVGNSAPPEKEKTAVDKKAHVDTLIGNGWAETDRDFLMKLEPEQLAKIKPVTANTTPPVVPPPPPVTTPPPVAPPAPVVNALKDLTPDQIFAMLPHPVQRVISEGMNALTAEKASHVAVITANASNSFTPQQLQDMPIDQLRATAKLVAPSHIVMPNFFGQNVPPPVVNAQVTEKPLTMPEIVFTQPQKN